MSRVIRRHVPVQTTVLSLEDLERQATAIVQNAEQTAGRRTEELKQQAQATIQSERERGYREGLDAGRKAGLEEIRATAAAAVEKARKDAQSDLKHLAASLQTALSEINANRHRLLAEAEHGIIELALAIARRVCGGLAAQSSEPAKNVVLRLLDLVRHAHDVELRVHPADLSELTTVVEERARTAVSLEHVKVLGDERIPRGGARLTSREGEIDATPETQLDRIAALLLGEDNDSTAENNEITTVTPGDTATETTAHDDAQPPPDAASGHEASGA